MKKGWVILYTVLILMVPCLAFGAAGSGSSAVSGSGSDTGAGGASAAMPSGMADRYQVTPDPNRPGSYKVSPLRPGDTGMTQPGTAGGGIYRVAPDPSMPGGYMATPESAMSGSGAGSTGSGSMGSGAGGSSTGSSGR